MFGDRYSFVNRWRVRGTPEEVFAILDDAPGLLRWWPSAWLGMEAIEMGDASGIGGRARVISKGWLPYLLIFTARMVEKEFPRRIVIESTGDLVGRGCWNLQAHGDRTDVQFRWEVRAAKPLLRNLSFLLKPLFATNHYWNMARGGEAIRLELARRHATNDAERARIPPPPPAVYWGRRLRRWLGMSEGRRKGLGAKT
jgi:hypothetical protein